jgi:hypothetical protein
MPRTTFSTTDLNELRDQLEQWRQSQAGVIRLPEALWISAATLAVTHGVGPVARTLRLDYSKLKRQVPQASAAGLPSAPAAFVELRPHQWLPQATTACRIELSDRHGAKMTLELPCDSATVVGVAQAFWRRA